jgi:hypothetical protein
MKNGAGTDGIDSCHNCFHIFLEAKINTGTLETNMKIYATVNIYMDQIRCRHGLNE